MGFLAQHIIICNLYALSLVPSLGGRNSNVYNWGFLYSFMDYSILEGIGLTSSEIKVYLALIDLGPNSTGPLVKKSGVSSSKIYDLLDKLIEKGLVTTYIQSNTNYFRAVNPKRLINYVQTKKQEVEEQEKQVRDILPVLESRFNKFEGETKVELFKGYKGIETLFKEMVSELKKGDEYLVVGGGDKPSANERTKLFFERIHLLRSKKGIKMRIIFSESRKKSLKEIKLFPNTSAKYFPDSTPSTINIYKDVTILLTMSPVPAAIRIKDKNITQSYKIYFEKLWKLAKR